MTAFLMRLAVPGGVRIRRRPVGGERGQAFVEYVLVLTAIALGGVAVATAWTPLATAITTLMTNVANAVASA